MVSISVLYVLLWLQVSLTESSCPNGWQRHDTTCYHFSHDTESLPVADMICKSMGGQLAEIDSDQESVFLSAQVASLNHHYWIGLTDIQEEGVWKWYNSKHTLQDTGVTNWATHEPDNTGDIENCVMLDSGRGFWWDHACHEYNRYICESQDESGVDVIG